MLVAAVRAEIRQDDFVGRIRADEFLLVLDECESEHAKGLVQRVRARLDQATAVRGEPVRVSFAAGIAWARSGERLNSRELVFAAERELEAAKQLTRDGARPGLRTEPAQRAPAMLAPALLESEDAVTELLSIVEIPPEELPASGAAKQVSASGKEEEGDDSPASVYSTL
jgi:hypothetical protein